MEGLTPFNILVAFAGGILSFLSPCVLPLVPGYISLISGVGVDQLKGEDGNAAARRAVIINSLAFNAGLSVVFLALGATAGLIGGITNNVWVRVIGGIIIILFGFQMMGVLKIGALYKDTRMFSNDKPRGIFGSFTLGLAFAAGWTPCIGPILSGIIGLAAFSGGWKTGLVLSAIYSIGLAVPFLLAGIGINKFLSFYKNFRQHLHKVEVVAGVILIMTGLLVATGYLTKLTSTGVAGQLAWIERKVTELLGGIKEPPRQQPTQTASNLKLAPELELQTDDGKPFKLSEQKGQVVVLNFWATWCVPCREEIPTFNDMQKDLGAKGLKIVGILTKDDPSGLKDFQKDLKQDYTIVIDNGSAEAAYEIPSALPVTVIVDRAGRIAHKFVGIKQRAEFEAAVKPLLETSQTTALK
jgi:cytochrome c-type biogenesis protein